MANAPLLQSLGPAGGGVPFWGLNDAGFSSNEGPLYAVDPWDTFWIGTSQMPGECRLEPGTVAAIEINKKKGKGLHGARITITGYDPREFSVSVQIATQEQWNALQDIVDLYWTIPGKTQNLSQISLSIYHPGLAFLKIYSAVLASISPPTDGKIEGTKVVMFKFQEAPNVTVKKNVTKSAGAPAEDKRKPAAASLASNAPPDPPESLPSNMSTSGPLQSLAGGP